MAISIINKQRFLTQVFNKEITIPANSVKTYSIVSDLGVVIPQSYSLCNVMFSASGLGAENIVATVMGWNFSTVAVRNSNSDEKDINLYMRCLFSA